MDASSLSLSLSVPTDGERERLPTDVDGWSLQEGPRTARARLNSFSLSSVPPLFLRQVQERALRKEDRADGAAAVALNGPPCELFNQSRFHLGEEGEEI